jgi:phosphoribosylpyrophosphate synthetase
VAGGTLIECKNALIKQGAKDVSAYVTHAIFPGDSWKRFTGLFLLSSSLFVLCFSTVLPN